MTDNVKVLAQKIHVALISNPERYKHISNLNLTNEKADYLDIYKAINMAERFEKTIK